MRDRASPVRERAFAGLTGVAAAWQRDRMTDSMRVVRGRVWLVAGCVAAVAVWALATSGVASAALWTGTTQGKFKRSSRLVEGAIDWRGNFWFRTDRSGNARGYAVVTYEPDSSVEGLNDAVGYVRDVAGAGIGALGLFAGAVGQAALGQIIGTDVSFESAAAVRQGPLTGRVANGRVSLRWQAKLDPVPYDIELLVVEGSQRVGGGTLKLQNPFDGSAQRVAPRGVVFSTDTSDESRGVTEQRGSYWVANRVD
jgi:hypothetical protein